MRRRGDAGVAAPYSCPCLTPAAAPRPHTPSPQGARVPRVTRTTRVRATGVAIMHP